MNFKERKHYGVLEENFREINGVDNLTLGSTFSFFFLLTPPEILITIKSTSKAIILVEDYFDLAREIFLVNSCI